MNLEFRTRLIGLRHKIAAHSITDQGAVFDAYHFFSVASNILSKMFSSFGNKISLKEFDKFHFTVPKFYYKDCKINKGSDDNIKDGCIYVAAKDSMFPEIVFGHVI